MSRVLGVVRRPRATFEAVVQRPSYGAWLTALFLVPFATAAVFLSTEVGQQALVDQWERTAIAFGRPIDDAAYAQMQEWSANPLPYAAATALLNGPVLSVAVALAVFALFRAWRGGPASFAQVLTVVAHAGVIPILRALVSLPLNYARESTASPTTLVQFFTMVDEASPVARLFGLIDVFVIWWLVVIGIGVSVAFREPVRRTVPALLAIYAIVAVVLAGTMWVLGGT